MDGKAWVEVIAALTMPLTIYLVVKWRIEADRAATRGSIRFLAAGLLIPALLILGLEKILEGTALGALIGTVIGAALNSTQAKPADEVGKKSN